MKMMTTRRGLLEGIIGASAILGRDMTVEIDGGTLTIVSPPVIVDNDKPLTVTIHGKLEDPEVGVEPEPGIRVDGRDSTEWPDGPGSKLYHGGYVFSNDEDEPANLSEGESDENPSQ